MVDSGSSKFDETPPLGYAVLQLLPPRRVLLLHHRRGVQMVPLDADASVVVGRASPADVVVADTSLSRQHARFTRDGDLVRVEDLGSTNGLFVGVERVEQAELSDDGHVRIGAVRVELHTLAASAPPLSGVAAHDDFLEQLHHECVRARYFRRPLSLVVLHGDVSDAGVAWYAEVQGRLRPVDRLALYGEQTLELMLPETDGDEAEALARAIIEASNTQGLRAGVAVFPASAGSAHELLDVALAAARRASPIAVVAGATSSDEVAPRRDEEELIVASAAMREVIETVEELAQATVPVLIIGEAGSGKELVARRLHTAGPRAEHPLIVVNCGAVPEAQLESVLFGDEREGVAGATEHRVGAFERADGGTVLLEAIGELPMSVQASLLRALESKHITRVGSTEERPVDVRVIAASNSDLEPMCAAERFRWDLYLRLDAVTLRVPPLADRIEAIEPLTQHFLAQANRDNGTEIGGVDDAALALMKTYRWRGNVRELKNAVQRAVVVARGAKLTVDDLPERVRASAAEGSADD